MTRSEKYLHQHLAKYPFCTRETCSHYKEYAAKVIFEEPDNGFIAHAEAFNTAQARVVIEEGVERDFPNLHLKSLDVKPWREVFGDLPYGEMPR